MLKIATGEEAVIREVTGIADQEKLYIELFMQGAVYAWINIHKTDPFRVRDLVGGENKAVWQKTPLYFLYSKHAGKPEQEAWDAAGRDIGWLTKKVLKEDGRTFERLDDDTSWGACYRWDGRD